MQAAGNFIETLNDVFLFPLIYLLSAIAFLFFVYGAVVYIMNADSEQARSEGKKHITYSIVGLVIMASAYAILSIAAGTFGLNEQLDCATNPDKPGCDSAFGG